MDNRQMIDVPMRREQIRNLRGLVNAEIDRWEWRPAWLVGLLEVLDDAETAGTIRNARLSALLDDLKAEMGSRTGEPL